MKKVVITVKHPEFKKQILDEIKGLKKGFLNFNRVVKVENEKPDSLYNFNIMLSDEEIETAKEDSRIQVIRVGSKLENNIAFGQGFTETKIVAANSTSIASNEINYGLVVCSNQTDDVTSSAAQYTIQRTLTGLGVDIVIMDTGVLRDHPELSDANGVSRVVELNWPQITETQTLYPNFTVNEHYNQDYPKQNSHGTCMAGLAAGKTCGWATEAKIYPIRIYGTDNSVFTWNQAINLVRLWHNTKKTSGNYRPTVVACSTTAFYIGNTFSSVTYRGSVFAYTNTSSASDKATVKITDQFSLNATNPFPAYSDSIAADYKAAIDAGVIVVNNAGNQGAYVDVKNGVDWNNECSGQFYNRGGSPSSEIGVITTGNIDTTITSNKRTIQVNSNRGPGVTIYAPGQNTVTCATSGTNLGLAGTGVFKPPVNIQYPGTTNPDYLLGKFGGTSAACPQVAGIVALFAEANPYLDGYAAIGLLKEFQKTDRVHVPTSDFLNGASLWGDTDRYVFNATANLVEKKYKEIRIKYG